MNKQFVLTLPAALLAVGLGLASLPTEAAVINFTTVRSGLGNSFGAFAVDPVTGRFYQRLGFNGETAMRVYASEADFAANNVLSNVTLAPGFFGTYISVNNGTLYGRADNSTSAVRTWNAATGAVTGSGSYPGMGGQNGTDTFDWGGFSGVNFMQDATGRYVFGGQASSNPWQIVHLGTGLAATSTVTYTPLGDPNLGWAFIINGTLFSGENYFQNIVTNAVDVNTGAVSLVNHTLSGLGSNYYLSDFSYDYSTDTLYAYNTNTQTLYKAANASVQFGVPLDLQVPVPGTLLLGLAGLLGLGVSRRRG